MSQGEAFEGKWKLVRSTENFEEFLEKMGAPWIARKMAANSSPTSEFLRDGDKFTLKTHTGFWTRETSFTIGVEDIQDHNGTKMKSLVTWDGDRMMIKEDPVEEGKGRSHTVARYINEEGEMIMEIKLDDLVCIRAFKKVP